MYLRHMRCQQKRPVINGSNISLHPIYDGVLIVVVGRMKDPRHRQVFVGRQDARPFWLHPQWQILGWNGVARCHIRRRRRGQTRGIGRAEDRLAAQNSKLWFPRFRLVVVDTLRFRSIKNKEERFFFLRDRDETKTPAKQSQP